MDLNIRSLINFFALSDEERDIYNKEILLVNTKRAMGMCVLGLFITLANIISFAQNIHLETGINLVWRQNVIIIHSVVFLIAFACLITLLIQWKFNARVIKPNESIVNVVKLLILSAGILLTIIDQILNMGIYPFLLVVIALGVIFYIKPAEALFVYVISVIVFYYGVELEINNSDVLLNARVNGISFGIIGLGLSFIFWKMNLRQIKLSEKVKRQNEELLDQHTEKDRLFSILAHDLKGPLGSFLSLTEVMAEDSDEHTKDELVVMSKALNRSSKKLYSLLENLLSYSRAKLQILQMSPVKIDLLAMGNEFVTQNEELTLNKGIELKVQIPNNVIVHTDLFMLQTIMRNLISNAIKFCSEGDIITITVNENLKDFVCISIADTGMGMNDELLLSLFKVGVKGRLGTKGESTSGLGLLLCQELISKIYGKIEVKSQENVGTTFMVYLPK